MSIRRPKSIKIGTFTYKVVYHRTIKGELGKVLLDKKEIHIYKHESQQTIRDTLLHETLHALFESVVETLSKMDCDDSDKEEAAIRFLTPRLLMLLIENPNFIAWLTKGTKK